MKEDSDIYQLSDSTYGMPMTPLDTNMSNNKPVLHKRRACKKTVQWTQVWYNFTQSTSFHGVKQIVEHQPFIARRFVWVVLFLSGLVVFLIQVGFSIKYYLAWPVSVDVKINYNDTIRFPAITICNENAFRATEAYYLGQYDLITALFTKNHHQPDMQQYNASHMSLEQLYMKTKHHKHDLIFKCEWDSIPCSADDFSTTLTDFGVCYTFNGGMEGQPYRNATQTGAQGGLRLQLNIEQYEYMRGPNDGAGVKLLVHEPHDIPLVKDHGLAVPAGMHAFVGLKIVEVHNLKPPHGKCNDSVALEHFRHYTMATCSVNCKQKHLLDTCGCRDIYMPGQQHQHQQQQQQQDNMPVCTLESLQTCMPQHQEVFNAVKQECDCPVPCNRVAFEPTVSYVATSNFDIDNLLGSNTTDILELQKRFIHAREVSHRTSQNTATKHNALVHSVRVMVEEIDEVFSTVTRSIQAAREQLALVFEELKARIHFHWDSGLEKVEYIIEHDFIRGWQVYEERVFDFVSSDYHNVYQSVLRTIEWMNRTIPTSEVSRREDVWWAVRNTLEGRLMLISQAYDNVTSADHAYRTGEPLQKFRTTIDRRYDMSFISLELLRKGQDKQELYFNGLTQGLNESADGLRQLINIGDSFVYDNTFSYDDYTTASDTYRQGCRRYNYRRFMFEERVIKKPLESIQQRMEKFTSEKDEVFAAYASITELMGIVTDLVEKTNKTHWRNVHAIVSMALEYESDISQNKTELAQAATSINMAEDIRQLKIEFAALRSRAQELSDDWRRVRDAQQQIWRTIVSETSTQTFYEMIHNDTVDFFSNASTSDFYYRIFADMLDMPQSELKSRDPEDLWYLMNADFHGLDLELKLANIDGDLLALQDSCQIATELKDKDEVFLQAFQSLIDSLQIFLNQNQINQQFYRENFLRLDVFMQELSYEEITQQPAYDLPKLLGDIGGSMGLFIGGSALSVFEFLDVIIHNGARLIFNR